MKTSRILTFILFVNLATGGLRASSAQSVTVPSVETTAAPADAPGAHALRISSGDLLDVAVFDTPELSGKLRVDEHGTITLPIAGNLTVSGLTAEQAAHAVEGKLLATNVLKEPHVSVAILEYATQGVTVVGEVKSPGVYPLLGAHSVLDLISAAGGLGPNAGKAVTVTHRDAPDAPVVVRIETKPGSRVPFNIDVRPGDTIMVSHAGIVYVVGDVGRPGGFMLESNDRLTVLQAIALAQGTNRTAALDQAKLLRKTDDGREQERVPLKKILANKSPDQTLADGDILFVPSSTAKIALRDLENILPAVAGAAIYRVP
jgi:polysaccharide biosynthesis/export protein